MSGPAVIAVLKSSHGSPMLFVDIQSAVGRRSEDVHCALERLVQRRLAVRTGRGYKGDPYRHQLRLGQESSVEGPIEGGSDRSVNE